MDARVMFLDCPHHVDDGGAVRCGLPAAVQYRYTAASTGALLESAKIRCPLGHWFNGPIDLLTLGQDSRADAEGCDGGGDPGTPMHADLTS